MIYAEVTIMCACPGQHIEASWWVWDMATENPAEANERAAKMEIIVQLAEKELHG